MHQIYQSVLARTVLSEIQLREQLVCIKALHLGQHLHPQ